MDSIASYAGVDRKEEKRGIYISLFHVGRRATFG
jgi:hypothetical protein